MARTNMAAFSGTAALPGVTHTECEIFFEIGQFRHINSTKVISYWRHFQCELELHSYPPPPASCSVQIRQTALSLLLSHLGSPWIRIKVQKTYLSFSIFYYSKLPLYHATGAKYKINHPFYSFIFLLVIFNLIWNINDFITGKEECWW